MIIFSAYPQSKPLGRGCRIIDRFLLGNAKKSIDNDPFGPVCTWQKYVKSTSWFEHVTWSTFLHEGTWQMACFCGNVWTLKVTVQMDSMDVVFADSWVHHKVLLFSNCWGQIDPLMSQYSVIILDEVWVSQIYRFDMRVSAYPWKTNLEPWINSWRNSGRRRMSGLCQRIFSSAYWRRLIEGIISGVLPERIIPTKRVKWWKVGFNPPTQVAIVI